MKVDGIPSFAPGHRYVVFLYGASSAGFSSPVGLGQGCFRIREQDGRRVVENDVGNRNLGDVAGAARARAGAAPRGAVPEPLPLASLLGRVRALAATP